MIARTDDIQTRMSDAEIVAEVEQLRQESDSVRNNFVDAWDVALQYYLGNQAPINTVPGLKYLVVNLTQNAVLAIAQIQAEQRPVVRISPQETNEPPVYYLRPGAIAPELANQLGLTADQLNGVVPLTEEEVAPLVTLAQKPTPEPVQQPVDENGQPQEIPQAQDATGQPIEAEPEQPIVPPDAIVPLDDQTKAEIYEALHSVIWERSNLDAAWLENIINKGITGHADMLCEWDYERYLLRWLNVHPLNLWEDPLATTNDSCEYRIFDQVLSADEAKAKFPEYSDLIDKYAEEGNVFPGSGGGDQYQIASIYRNTRFGREMVTITHFWRKNHPFPLTVEEALQAGLVQQAVEDIHDDTDTQSEGQATDSVDAGSVPVDAGQEAVGGRGNGAEHAGVDGMGTADRFRGIPDTYILIGEEDEDGNPVLTAPDNDNWPTRPGIREVVLVNQAVADDRECQYDRIPIVRNINIPIPHRFYGIGEPERMKPVQDACNLTYSTLYNTTRYGQSPQIVMDTDVRSKLGDKANAPFSAPNKIWTVPRKPGEKLSELIQFIDPPQIDAAKMQLAEQFRDIFHEISGHTEQLQGQTDTNAKSGVAIQQLQSAARGVISLRSMYTERAMIDQTRFVMGIVRDEKKLPDEELVRMVTKYPAPMVIAAVRSMTPDSLDIKVSITSGGGQTQQQKEQRALALHQAGLYGPRKTLEAMNDPDVDETLAELQQAAMAQQQAKDENPPKEAA